MATLLLAAGTARAAQSPSGKARGIPVAAITIEVFSDFQCPACKALYEQTLKPLVADHVDKGKVYLVHRDFPLPIHAYARKRLVWPARRGGSGSTIKPPTHCLQIRNLGQGTAK
jgi:hypothetical protein